jgi:hypothetical protein
LEDEKMRVLNYLNPETEYKILQVWS